MPFSSRSYVNRYIPSNRFPTGVKWLLIVTVCLSVFDLIVRSSSQGPWFLQNFALVPAQVVQRFAFWQVFTYLFLHAGIGHVLWNMLALWMFGAELERTWGTRRFLGFYFACGIIAGLAIVIGAYLFGATHVSTVGSSGAIYGVLMAYAVLFPNQTILFGFLIPMKTKYFVMIIGAVVLFESYVAVAQGHGAVAPLAELTGLVAGYLILRGRRLRHSVGRPLSAGYRGWKLRRARKKFEVYLRKKDSNRDRWVH